MGWRSLFWVCVAIATTVLLVGREANGMTDPTDVGVLKELLKNVGGTVKLPSWSGDDPCGDRWEYIRCVGSSVTGIQLQQTHLHGELPPTLNKMVNLKAIALQGNNFTGPLPTMSGLASLQTAYLDFQSFTSIPADFFHGLTSLTLISLDYSSLNDSNGGWSLPPNVADLQQLITLSLTQTHLSGNLPEFLAAMPNLQNVRLAYNHFSGSIPPSYSGASFVTLQLNNMQGPNPLSGSIAPVGGMLSLALLWLQVNAFSGPIPEGLGSLASLRECKLNDNELAGPIPSSLSASSSLTVFSVQHNHLSGSVPKIASLNPDNFTYSDGNLFCSATIGAPCAPEVNALLAFLGGVGYPSALASDWGGNNPCVWSGIICNPSSKVITINLPKRSLSGIISPAIANLNSLQSVILNDNNLTGTIPASLASLTSLRRVALQNNNLDAPVPQLPGVDLNVTGNPNISKEKPAPSPDGSEKKVPPKVPAPPVIAEEPSSNVPPAGSSNYSGSSPGGSSPGLPSNTTVVPSNMTGQSAPTQVSKAMSSKRSSVAVVAGGIAGAVGMAFLVCLLALFLIKKRRTKFRSLQTSNSVVVHPAGSSDDPDCLKPTIGNRVDLSENHITESVMSGSDGVQMVEAGNLLISIQVLRNVTNNFSQENVVGKGGFGVVYKGELDDGTKIAVKRMEACVVSNKGLKEFHSEIAVLTKVRHRHLVALLGYCIDGSERLLVYEYMPLGPLSQHLFEFAKLGLPPLNLKRRLSIALDVARGMEYLHGLAHHRSFIHRDLKPSNILLGDDYRAKVSDFGLVKLASEEKNSIETRLAGTFGYLAPEYAVTGRVTTKSDVFSFGVVLMELITGRRALDESQPEESVHLAAWFRRMSASSDNFLKAIDPELEVTEESSLKSIKAVAELAGHCTSREAWNRPDMGHAVSVLLPLVEQWKPTDIEGDDGIGIDLDMTLPQALKKWQAFEGSSLSSSSTSAFFGEDTNGSMPSRPLGFAESFTSNDGR
ncbi:hypothetical protein GOP47_0018368 [Adiantum capillus-veneris]|uniref:Protein kinase domain-containing protein n=1 Tax=Adiantum capillus-veneris TaxID=13818 RepID=A0A9D4ZBT6_ADICA|nr:hypothetical protein GOP47_0018368 [Adiantum capillus-veneris]